MYSELVMKIFSRRKSARRRMPILANLFVLLAIPLGIYALIATDTFDTRNRAFEPELIKDRCIISFPYVNPQTIQSGSTVQVQVVAFVPGAAITNLNLLGQAGQQISSKSYDIPDEKLSEVFRISPSSIGEYTLLGTISTDRGTIPCTLDGARVARAVSINNAPEFLTQATSAKPSNSLKVNDTYEYTLRAEDTDGDNISYHFSFTPNADWLKYTAIEDGSDGKLTIKFTGVPDQPASYLANIFIHDGYNANLRAQTWTISVGQDKNDTPKVTVYSPAVDSRVEKGERITVSWEVTDLNQISRQELYIATDAGNPSSWVEISKNLSGNTKNYIFDTSNMSPGRYQFVVRAIDNGEPVSTGTGASTVLSISVPATETDPEEEKPDDGIILQDPQVINVSPANNSRVEDRNTLVTATLIAGTDSKIEEESITFVLDDQDKTEDVELNRISESEITITYKPNQIHSIGLHKASVTFKDEKGGQAERSWVFNIVEKEEEEDDTYNIFGFEISKRMAWILGGGIGILLLALIVPWLLYLAWRGEDDSYEQAYKNSRPFTPPPTTTTYEKEKIMESQSVPVQATIQAPKPVVIDTAVNPPIEEKIIVETPKPVEPVVIEQKIEVEPQEIEVKVESQKPQVDLVQPAPVAVQPDMTPQEVVVTEVVEPEVIVEAPVQESTNDGLIELAEELKKIEAQEDGIEIQDTPPTPQVGV